MLITAILLMTLIAGAERSRPPVLTPKAVETRMAKSLATPGSPYWDGPAIVECGVASVSMQRVTGPDGKAYENIVLQPSGESTRFSIALSPKAQAALKRVGIDDFDAHFRDKTVRVEGRIGLTSLNLFGSPTVYFFDLQVDSLDQFLKVRSENRHK